MSGARSRLSLFLDLFLFIERCGDIVEGVRLFFF